MPGLFTIHSDFQYEITRKLSEGGMGMVYEAEQRGTRGFSKRVAIKVVRQNFANQPMFIENFIGEAKLVSDLIHTNIVQTYHLGEARGIYFIAMELIRGVNLEQFTQQLTDKQKQLPAELAVFITSRVARGLAYAHAKTDKDGKDLGIVHRDVSFKNIMIAFEGDVKLTDFGIAEFDGYPRSEQGTLRGTVAYMSPEQVVGDVVDTRSDLYSVGIVLWELVANQRLFPHASELDLLARVRDAQIPLLEPLRPGVPEYLARVVRQATFADREKRFQTAPEFARALQLVAQRNGWPLSVEALNPLLGR